MEISTTECKFNKSKATAGATSLAAAKIHCDAIIQWHSKISGRQKNVFLFYKQANLILLCHHSYDPLLCWSRLQDTHTVSKNLLLTVNANGWVIWRQWLHMRPQDTLKQAHRHGIVLCFPDDSLVGQLTTLKHALFKSLWQQKLRARSWYRGCDGNMILSHNFSFTKNS